MADQLTLEIENEVEGWKKELESLKVQGVRIAKVKLIELENIGGRDITALQNWTSSLFWLSRRNKVMEEAEVKVKKRARKGNVEAEPVAAEQADVLLAKDITDKFLKAVPTIPHAEPTEPTGTEKMVAPRRFKDFTDLRAFYDSRKARRVDGRVSSSSLKVRLQDDQLFMDISAPTTTESRQTVEPGSYPMLNVGIVTFCRRLGMSYTYFSRYPVKTEIVEHMNVLNSNHPKEYIIRVLQDDGGSSVQAVLPKGFVAIDHADIFAALAPFNPRLDFFSEGPFDKAVDYMDFGFEGPVVQGMKPYRPVLRVVNSEVDMSPVLFNMGVTDGPNSFITMSKIHGGVRVPHRAKAGEIKDWLVVPEMAAKNDALVKALDSADGKPVSKLATSEFLTSLGLLGPEVARHIEEYFIAFPCAENLLAYAAGITQAAKSFPLAKMQKMSDLAVALCFGEIPVM